MLKKGKFSEYIFFLKVGPASSECREGGGSACALDFEDSKEHRVTVLVSDDGVPPQSAMFNTSVVLTDVNDRPTNLTLSGV